MTGTGPPEVLIDESASEDQRNALGTILSGAAAPLFEILAEIVTTLHGPHFVSIEWEFDKEAHGEARGRRLRRDGERAAVDSGDGRAPAHPCADAQRLEYKEAEVAGTTVRRGTGEIKFDWEGTHSSLAEIEYTDEALVS